MALEHPSTHPIDRARESVLQRPLQAVDLALVALGATRGHRSAAETTHYLDVLAIAIMAANSCPDSGRDDPVTAMLDEGSCDSLATAALLRLLVLDEDVFTDDERLRPAIGLFDRVLEARLYRTAGVAVKDQAFEKRAKLRNAVAEHEIALQAHVDSLGSLDALAPFRQQLSKLFADQVSQLVVRPFMPGVTIQTLNEVLTAVQAVVEAADDQVPERAEAASVRCQELSAEANEIGTAYARGLVAGLVGTLQDLVGAELRGRGLADPATVTVAARPKMYPLGHVGIPVVLRLDVANEGPGQARDTAFSIEGDQRLAFEDPTRELGLLAPGVRRIDVRGVVTDATTSEVVLVRVTWRDPDGSEREHEQLIDLKGQDTSVDWDALEYEDPYPLEAITEADRFVGRDTVLRTLTKAVLGAAPGNARIQGQRRVGKTSVANALPARVEAVRPGVYRFVCVQSGDFNANTAEETIERLGGMVAEQVRAADPRLGGLNVPRFTAGLSPLTEFFAASASLAPDLRFILILDEFDAMPHPGLYDHGPVATALMQTLRSLGSKPNVGIVLIGGERMRFILATHGQALNRFQLVPVDYFDDDHYGDYVALLREPVESWLSIDDEAVRLLHEETAGNPWITKSIAGQLFDRHRGRRDGDVRVDDMAEAITASIPRLGATSFQHFWDDAIHGGVEDQRHVSLARRKVLLAIASCLRDRAPLNEDTIVRAARRYEIDGPNTLDVLRGLTERAILLASGDGTLEFRLPLFARWLADEGVREIVVTMGDDDALIRRQRAEEAIRPRTEELNAGMFRAIHIEAPPGSILNAKLPAAVFTRSQTCQRVVDLIYGALGEADPTLRRGQSHGTNTMLVTSGEDPRSGEFYAYIETLGGGGGAGPEHQGVNAVQVHITNTSNLPVESLELEYPLQVVEYSLIEESEGAGDQSGGRGIRRRIRILSDATVVEYNGTRLTTSPSGAQSGQPGGQGRCWIERPDGERLDHSDQIDFSVEAGDVVGVDTPGGGGYGG